MLTDSYFHFFRITYIFKRGLGEKNETLLSTHLRVAFANGGCKLDMKYAVFISVLNVNGFLFRVEWTKESV